MVEDYKTALIAGDGVGPEVAREALNVLQIVAEKKSSSMRLGCSYGSSQEV